MLSTLVHIKDKNELENHCAFCFFISIKSGFGSTQCDSVTGGFVMGAVVSRRLSATGSAQCCLPGL